MSHARACPYVLGPCSLRVDRDGPHERFRRLDHQIRRTRRLGLLAQPERAQKDSHTERQQSQIAPHGGALRARTTGKRTSERRASERKEADMQRSDGARTHGCACIYKPRVRPATSPRALAAPAGSRSYRRKRHGVYYNTRGARHGKNREFAGKRRSRTSPRCWRTPQDRQ